MPPRVLHPRVLLQGKIKNCQTQSVSWQVQPSPLTITCWSNSCWSQAETRAVLSLSEGTQHPKEGQCTADHPENNPSTGHCEKSLSVQWTRVTSHLQGPQKLPGRRDHLNVQGSLMYMFNYLTGYRGLFMKRWWSSCCKMRNGTKHAPSQNSDVTGHTNLLPLLIVYLFIMHWTWKTTENLFQLYCIYCQHILRADSKCCFLGFYHHSSPACLADFHLSYFLLQQMITNY